MITCGQTPSKHDRADSQAGHAGSIPVTRSLGFLAGRAISRPTPRRQPCRRQADDRTAAGGQPATLLRADHSVVVRQRVEIAYLRLWRTRITYTGDDYRES
jgi:hypothetical protein